MRDAIGMADRVLHSQQAAPGVAQDRYGFEAEAATHSLEVRDLRLDADLSPVDPVARPAATSLVVVHEPKRVREPVELRTQVVVVEVRAAMEDDDGRSAAERSAVQTSAPGRQIPLYRERVIVTRTCRHAYSHRVKSRAAI